MKNCYRLLTHSIVLILLGNATSLAVVDTQNGANGGPGMNGGDAIAIATSTDPSNTATATGGLGGSGVGGNQGGTGGQAVANSQSTPASGSAIATSTSTGGNGGIGANGGTGGSAMSTASATSTDGDATGVVTALGGNGNFSSGGDLARGGSGGDATGGGSISTITGNGMITVTVVGGSGAPIAGTGGNAVISPTQVTSVGGNVTGIVEAIGGTGPISVPGSRGGDASSQVDVMTGGGASTATAMATSRGGEGDALFLGNASARSSALSTGIATVVTSTASAFGPTARASATARGLHSTLAQANASMLSNPFNAQSQADAFAASGMIVNLESHTNIPFQLAAARRSEARAGVRTTLPQASDATGLQLAALSVGLPEDSVALDFFAGNPMAKSYYNIASDLVPGATSDLLGLVTLGGSNNTVGGLTAVTASVVYAIDLNALTNPRQDLLVSLLDTHVEGTGFASLGFQIIREGMVVVNETFSSLNDAILYFDDHTLNLGSNALGNVSGNLDLQFSLSLTTNDVGAGFYFDLVFGNSTVPEPGAGAWLVFSPLVLSIVRRPRKP